MRCRTHIVVANALSLALLQPQNIKELSICIGAATIGGVISDLDVRTSDSHKAVDFVILLTLLGILVSYFLDLKYNYGIYKLVINSPYYINILGILLILGICFFGMHQPHRSFLHSFLAIFLLTGILFICYDYIWLPFLIGMLSHVSLDIFNKRRVKLFYPLGRGLSFKLCSYDSFIDTTIFIVGLIFIISTLFFI